MGRKVKKRKSRYRSTGGPEGKDFNDRGPKNASSRTRGEGSDIKEPVNLFNLTPSPVASFFGEARVIPKWQNVGGPQRGGVTSRWPSSRDPMPERKRTTRDSLMEGNMAGVDVILRLLVSRAANRRSPMSVTCWK